SPLLRPPGRPRSAVVRVRPMAERVPGARTPAEGKYDRAVRAEAPGQVGEEPHAPARSLQRRAYVSFGRPVQSLAVCSTARCSDRARRAYSPAGKVNFVLVGKEPGAPNPTTMTSCGFILYAGPFGTSFPLTHVCSTSPLPGWYAPSCVGVNFTPHTSKNWPTVNGYGCTASWW